MTTTRLVCYLYKFLIHTHPRNIFNRRTRTGRKRRQQRMSSPGHERSVFQMMTTTVPNGGVFPYPIPYYRCIITLLISAGFILSPFHTSTHTLSLSLVILSASVVMPLLVVSYHANIKGMVNTPSLASTHIQSLDAAFECSFSSFFLSFLSVTLPLYLSLLRALAVYSVFLFL
jgi:hypothetical protein